MVFLFRETSRFLIAIPLLLTLGFFFHTNPFIPLLAYSIAVLAAAIWSYILWYTAVLSDGEEGIERAVPSTKMLLRLSIPLFTVSALAQLTPLITSLLLGVYGTVEDVGIFSVATRIASLLSLPLMLVNMVSAPSFAEMHAKNDMGSIRETAMQSTRLIFITSLPLLICCILIPGMMMNIFGSNMGAGSTALVIIAIAQFVNAIAGSVGVIMQMTGNEKTWALILIITTILQIAGMHLLVPRYGINGAAISLAAAIIINNVAGALWLRIKMNINTFYIPFMKS